MVTRARMPRRSEQFEVSRRYTRGVLRLT